jgi:hypothetical protein
MHSLLGVMSSQPGGGFGLPVREGVASDFLLFRFEGAVTLPLQPSRHRRSSRAQLLGRRCPLCSQPFAVRWVAALLENSIASTSIFVLQATKSQRWMPWRLMPMKDVGDCEKLRGAVDQASIRRCPNGETRHPLWGVTPA